MWPGINVQEHRDFSVSLLQRLIDSPIDLDVWIQESLEKVLTRIVAQLTLFTRETEDLRNNITFNVW